MTIPEVPSLLLPVLRLGLQREEFRPSEHYEELADLFGLTQAERSQMQEGGNATLFGNRVSWALVNLGRARLVAKVRGGDGTA